MARAAFRHGIRTLFRPHKTYEELDNLTLEKMVKYYLQLLIIMGITAGILTFLWNLGRAVYYEQVLDATINYARMLNYLAGRVFSVMFGYLMVGTFGMFLLSIIINPFLKMKYTRILKILFTAATPIIMLVWIPGAATGIILWAVILFILGVKDAGKTRHVKKTSLHQRD